MQLAEKEQPLSEEEKEFLASLKRIYNSIEKPELFLMIMFHFYGKPFIDKAIKMFPRRIREALFNGATQKGIFGELEGVWKEIKPDEEKKL
ncbi:MAG: hypothetical protein KJ621_21090 [Proteobacteria bacterium]|nr:hypothetical protein [Pseudomonadota bacterium]